MRRLLARCLEKDRNLRLRDIGDASLELRDAASPQPESSSVVRVERASPKRLVVGVGLGLVAGAAIAAGTLWATRSPPPPKAIKRFAITMPATASFGSGGGMRSVVVSPDGGRLAFVGVDGRLYLRALDSLDLVPVSFGVMTSGPFFSPDSRWVATFSAGTSELQALAGHRRTSGAGRPQYGRCAGRHVGARRNDLFRQHRYDFGTAVRSVIGWRGQGRDESRYGCRRSRSPVARDAA